jgi:hypothetical protein
MKKCTPSTLQKKKWDILCENRMNVPYFLCFIYAKLTNLDRTSSGKWGLVAKNVENITQYTHIRLQTFNKFNTLSTI